MPRGEEHAQAAGDGGGADDNLEEAGVDAEFDDRPASRSAFKLPVATVLAAIKTFKRRTGCGALGLQAQHLKDAIRTGLKQQNHRAASAITAVVERMLSGAVPPELAPILTTAPLMALRKPGGPGASQSQSAPSLSARYGGG